MWHYAALQAGYKPVGPLESFFWCLGFLLVFPVLVYGIGKAFKQDVPTPSSMLGVWTICWFAVLLAPIAIMYVASAMGVVGAVIIGMLAGLLIPFVDQDAIPRLLIMGGASLTALLIYNIAVWVATHARRLAGRFVAV
jgi:hypothetical protein